MNTPEKMPEGPWWNNGEVDSDSIILTCNDTPQYKNISIGDIIRVVGMKNSAEAYTVVSDPSFIIDPKKCGKITTSDGDFYLIGT